MKARGLFTLRSSILFALLGIGLLPVLVILVASQVHMRDIFEANGRWTLESMTGEVARQVSDVLLRIQSQTRALAEHIALRYETQPLPDLLHEMRLLRDTFALLEDVSLYDEQGALVGTTTERFWESVRYTEWFERALQGEFVLTPPIRLPARQGLYVCGYQHIPKSSSACGIVFAVRCSFKQVQTLVQSTRIGQSGWMVLLDYRGNALAFPDAAQILQRPFGKRSGKWWLDHPVGTLKDVNGELIFYHARMIHPLHTGTGDPWILVGLLPFAEIASPLRAERVILGAATAVTLLAILLTGIALSRTLTKPLRNVTRAAETISVGNLAVMLPQEGPEEVQTLAGAFNRMVKDLRTYREHVEAVVEQRTAGLRESQSRLEKQATYLRAALESLVDGILMVQWPEGRVLAANHPFAVLFNLQAWEPLTGRTLQEIEQRISPCMVDSRTDRFCWAQFKHKPEAITLEEWELVTPARRVLSVSSTAAIGPNGMVLARLYLFRDLTEQRQLEEGLRQAQKMEAVGRLAGGIAHDFNNLLTGILGNLSMAEMDSEDARQRTELISAARQAAQRAADLVRQLLGFSRRSRLRLESCDVNKVVQDVRNLFKHSVDPRIVFDINMEPNLWRVRADPIQIQQVIMNLCVNAMDAMPTGGRLIVMTSNVRITLEQARQWLDGRSGEFVRIAVADEGHGMSQEAQSHLFEPFFTTKEPGKGTGLGLALSYGIIRQHGGWITFDSELNRGTTFYVFLPRSVEEGVVEDEKEPAEPAVHGGEERVLVVDDEAAMRAVVVAILRRYGYRAIEAAHGEEALQILASGDGRIDVIVLDLTMPKMSGRETLQKLRQFYPKLPVIVSSGYPIDLDGFEQETGLRPDGVVQKPYEAKAFASVVRQVLDAARSS